MRGAYTLKRDSSSCIYSQAASYYSDFDFAPVISCEKKPIIVDLPPERVNKLSLYAAYHLLLMMLRWYRFLETKNLTNYLVRKC